MSYLENIKDSFRILAFNETALKKVANNNKATGYGFLTLIIAGIAGAIITLDPLEFIKQPASTIIGFIVGYSIFHFIAKFLLKGKATGAQYFRSLSNPFVIYWFTFIPVIGSIIGFIGGLWILIINVFILNKLHKLSMAKAIILGLLPLVLIVVLIAIGSLAYFGALDPSAFLPVE